MARRGPYTSAKPPVGASDGDVLGGGRDLDARVAEAVENSL
jgi:hypothetical protein